jgi:hypothetical protein
MLTKVEVRNIAGALLTLQLEDILNGFIVEEITGLDPVKAVLVSSGFAGLDGVQYQSSRREARQLTFRIGLEPDYGTESVESLRRTLYSFFMTKAPVNLRFYMSDGLTIDIDGRVETFESPLFVKEPAVDITLLCFDPDFYDSVPVVLSGSTVSTTTDTLITYPGTVETGILFTLNVDRTLSEFTIYHRAPDGITRSLDFSGSLAAGNVLKISTIVGAKGATKTVTGVESSVLYGVSPQSNWIELQPGENHIRVYAVGAAIPYTITYTKRYGGL